MVLYQFTFTVFFSFFLERGKAVDVFENHVTGLGDVLNTRRFYVGVILLLDSFKVSLPLFFFTNGVVDHHCVCNLLPCVVFASVRCESSFRQQINVW